MRVVDTIITELAVIRVTPEGLVLEELAPGVTGRAGPETYWPEADRALLAGLGQLRFSIQCVNYQSRRLALGIHGRGAERIDCVRRAACHRDVLLAVDHEGHRRAQQRKAGLDVQKLLAVVGAISDQAVS